MKKRKRGFFFRKRVRRELQQLAERLESPIDKIRRLTEEKRQHDRLVFELSSRPIETVRAALTVVLAPAVHRAAFARAVAQWWMMRQLQREALTELLQRRAQKEVRRSFVQLLVNTARVSRRRRRQRRREERQLRAKIKRWFRRRVGGRVVCYDCRKPCNGTCGA